jgi:hypothetical protein
MNIPPEVPDQRTTNLVFSDHSIKIRDVRGSPQPASIDEKGFIFRKHQTKLSTEGFLDRETVEKIYLPEIEELLKKELGEESVDRVFFFDWRVFHPYLRCFWVEMKRVMLIETSQLRKNAPEIEGEVIDMNDLTTWLRPAMHVHIGMFPFTWTLQSQHIIDQSASAVLRRIQLQLPDEADFLLVSQKPGLDLAVLEILIFMRQKTFQTLKIAACYCSLMVDLFSSPSRFIFHNHKLTSPLSIARSRPCDQVNNPLSPPLPYTYPISLSLSHLNSY